MLCDLAQINSSVLENNIYGLPSFESTVKNLKKFKHSSFKEIESQLFELKAGLSMSRVIREVGLQDDPRLKTLVAIWDKGSYLSAILDVIEELFPIMREVTDESIYENEIVYIYPFPQGLNWYSYEGFFEAVQTPEDNFGPAQSLEVFIKCLDQTIDGEAWERCNEFFGWSFPEAPDYQTNCYLDLEKLENCLHCAQMDGFRAAIDVAVGMDNLFFEFNPNDDGEPIEFTAENITRLQEEWSRAKETLEEVKKADAMLSENPALYQKFADLWNSALVKHERVKA